MCLYRERDLCSQSSTLRGSHSHFSSPVLYYTSRYTDGFCIICPCKCSYMLAVPWLCEQNLHISLFSTAQGMAECKYDDANLFFFLPVSFLSFVARNADFEVIGCTYLCIGFRIWWLCRLGPIWVLLRVKSHHHNEYHHCHHHIAMPALASPYSMNSRTS